jgi:glutamyl-tRNA(Gln) amidotransferase subunit E
MLTPDEAAEAAQYLRLLARSSGKVRTGIGAARQDVNVSITGGTRVEIKGVAHIKWIPELTHNEAFRQKALLEIRSRLREAVPDPGGWRISARDISYDLCRSKYEPLQHARAENMRLVAINLPGFESTLSFFTQPNQTFAAELSGRLKVIACLEQPNLIHSEQLRPVLTEEEFGAIRDKLEASDDDAQLLVWGGSDDVDTALETIEERCLMAFEGVPNETRKSLPDGTTVFERVLPGPDRMYPDTDSAPISIDDGDIEKRRANLPPALSRSMDRLRSWRVPVDTFPYILRRNMVPLMERIIDELDEDPVFVGTLFGHTLKHLEGKHSLSAEFCYDRIYDLFKYLHDKGVRSDIAKAVLPEVCSNPDVDFRSVLDMIGYTPRTRQEILSRISALKQKFWSLNHSKSPGADERWIMGQLRTAALGNMPLNELHVRVEEETADD